MKIIAAIVTTALGLIVLTGCSPEEQSQAKINQACVRHGGVYHVERHEKNNEDGFMYLFMCEDKTIQRVYP